MVQVNERLLEAVVALDRDEVGALHVSEETECGSD